MLVTKYIVLMNDVLKGYLDNNELNKTYIPTLNYSMFFNMSFIIARIKCVFFTHPRINSMSFGKLHFGYIIHIGVEVCILHSQINCQLSIKNSVYCVTSVEQHQAAT